jgi:hypothetical protein
MQIHHVETAYEDRFVLDPALGPVKRREQVMRQSGIDRIMHDGKTYERGPDGTFEVPDEVGAFLCGRSLANGSFSPGPNPFVEESPPKRTPKRT